MAEEKPEEKKEEVKVEAKPEVKAEAKEEVKAEAKAETKKEEKAAAIDFEKMTVVDLREYALKNHPNIAGVSAMKKEALLLAIYEARGETPPEVKKKAEAISAAHKAGKKKALKEKIRLLRADLAKLRAEKKPKDLVHLRRKIKRLKRQTRKAA